MTGVFARVDAVRSSGDRGSALAIALAFLMVFGVYVGAVLQFAAAGQRSTVLVQEEATSTYAGGGGIDAAINQVSGSLSTGVDPGTATPPAASTCFTLPAGELGNPTPITVSCQPRSGSGGYLGGLSSQPGQSVLAVSGHASEGVVLTAAARVKTTGSVYANRLLNVPTGATLTSAPAEVKAGTCTVAGTSTPPCVTSTVPSAPSWPGPTAYPQVVTSTPACTSPVVALSPGTYLSRVDLQDVLDCGNTVVWFQPGVYYFDFRGGGSRELVVGNNDVVVGGTPSGWTPGVTPRGSVPFPTAASPGTSACDVSQQGVDMVFAGDSRINVASGGDLQLCAEQTGAGSQHVVLRGLSAQSAALPVTQPTAGTATDAQDTGSGTRWTNEDEGAAIDDDYATVDVPRNGSARPLRVGPFPDNLVPPEATNISVTVDVSNSLDGPGTMSVRINDDASTILAPVALRTCPPAGCADTAVRTDSVTINDPALTSTLVNDLYVDVMVSSGNGGATDTEVDGVTVSVDFSAPMRPTSGSGVSMPYGGGTPTALLRSAGASPATVLSLHGTVYAPLAAVDLANTSVPYVVVDRGIVVRHLRLAMTNAAAYTGPLISVPALPQDPRTVVMTAVDAGGRTLARALVSFSNPAGTANGTSPRVLEWSIS